MMKPPLKTPKPTDAELEILHALWDLGPATVRGVHDVVTRTKPSQYTTTLKQMQVMHDKGLLARDASERSHTYTPAVGRADVQRQMATHLLERAFRGSARGLLVELLGARRTSKQELAELRQILDDHEKGGKSEKGGKR